LNHPDDKPTIPTGVCPACEKAIALNDINVTQDFRCSHCQKLVRTSTAFRVLIYLVGYGVPTLVVALSGRPLVASVVRWIFLVCFIALLNGYVTKRLITPRLELSLRKDDDFQSLHLND
jgi:hypothetical protein